MHNSHFFHNSQLWVHISKLRGKKDTLAWPYKEVITCQKLFILFGWTRIYFEREFSYFILKNELFWPFAAPVSDRVALHSIGLLSLWIQTPGWSDIHLEMTLIQQFRVFILQKLLDNYMAVWFWLWSFYLHLIRVIYWELQ